jgi:hypothetical protein
MGKNSMNIRNAKRISPTTLDCEIEHYELGWIPYTASEEDEETLIVYARILNGEAGEIEDAQEPTGVILARLKEQAYADIDATATRARRRYTSPEKDATYTLKDAEMRRWVEDGRPEEVEAGMYPYIEREAFYTSSTITDIGTLIETMANQWKMLDPEIEGICRGGKVGAKAIDIADEDAEQQIMSIWQQTVNMLDSL